MNTQDLTPRCDGSVAGENRNKCLDGMSLAMVYSPCQEFRALHTAEDALSRGTLFTELEKPFWGARRLK